MTYILCFRVDKCKHLIKMQILLSRKKTADPNYQQQMPKPLTYSSNSTCNLDNLARGSLKLLLLLLSFYKTPAVLYRAAPVSSAARPCFCLGTCSHQVKKYKIQQFGKSRFNLLFSSCVKPNYGQRNLFNCKLMCLPGE